MCCQKNNKKGITRLKTSSYVNSWLQFNCLPKVYIYYRPFWIHKFNFNVIMDSYTGTKLPNINSLWLYNLSKTIWSWWFIMKQHESKNEIQHVLFIEFLFSPQKQGLCPQNNLKIINYKEPRKSSLFIHLRGKAP